MRGWSASSQGEPLAPGLRDGRERLDPCRRGSASRLDADDRKALVDSGGAGMQTLGLRG